MLTRSLRVVPILVTVLLFLSTTVAGQAIRPPSEFFGFEIGADGELARYPRVLEYLQHLAERSDRVMYEERGTTTNGHPYALVKFSAAANLERLDRLVEINHRLADSRGL